MHVKSERIAQDIAALAQFGALPGGGVTRIAFSPEDVAARAYLRKAMEAAGLMVTVDAFGNMRGRRDGQYNLPPVAIGSHIDTVPEGGNFDGVIGVVGALEVVRALNDNDIVTRRPIEVINFASEESSRVGVGTLGSKIMAGKWTKADLKRTDKQGVTLYETLEQVGLQPNELATARVKAGTYHAFLEMHIEQGPVLESEGIPVGIVTSIAAPTRFRVVIKGRADHSGNTPMHMRQDALAGASELILGVEEIAATLAGPTTVGTVGYAFIRPGAMNVIPGEVELGIDIRDIDSAAKSSAVEKVKALITKIAVKRKLKIGYDILADDEPVLLADKIINRLEKTAQGAGISYRRMPSGAGHDAMHMAELTDVGMIFVPSIDGVSHNTAEYSRSEDIATGTQLLLLTTLDLAQEE